GDLGYGDLGYGDLGYGDLGYGDLGYGDLGYGDLGAPRDEPLGPGDLNLDTAGSLGNAPNTLTAIALKGNNGIQLSWLPPNVAVPIASRVTRVEGASVPPPNSAARVRVANVPGASPSIPDPSSPLNPTRPSPSFVVPPPPPPPGCVPTPA